MQDSITSMPLKTRTEGMGLDLFLLHGWGTNSKAFDAFIPHLRQHYRITTIDLPGFGENYNNLPADYTLDSICEQLASVIENKGIMIGWSLGGLIAQQFALNYPDKTLGLIGIATTPYFMQKAGWPGIKPEVMSLFTTQLTKSYSRTVERFLAIQAMGSQTAKQDIKALRTAMAELPEPSTVALEKGLGLLQSADIRGQISRILCPTLRIYGRRDTLIPASAIDPIHALHPQSDSVILADAAHAPFMSHPAQCQQIIRQFIERAVAENNGAKPRAYG
ncbi:pimeloyl-[acyl-carrier protein] methyl ester esterase [Alteromonas sediminis]|uniref:Pimeloyl-[acyl-carrier protein] methyl ester esterase n=1 Tax=Alteromonas sediminis TaxID=2259342 RepID=A0A3N5XZI7_9ALTE|nr:pimeloyl-ACP methyl ester esterase BioH [Alteromonas sediminis]RPJ66502.1 pimeloyl-[acyl-carrier protein] methyl ester esterase [Alteromonas sediminis]